MIIVDHDIHKLIQERALTILSINEDLPFNPTTQIGPGSIDLRLSSHILKYKQSVLTIDPTATNDTESIEIQPDEYFLIQPNEMILTTTLEIVILPANIAGLVAARSSIARLGLLVHVAQNFIQPGHRQLIPLQLVNITNRPIKIKPFLPICQITLLSTSSKAEFPYASNKNAKYRNELSVPQASKLNLEQTQLRHEPGTSNQSYLTPQEIEETVQEIIIKSKDADTHPDLDKRLTGILGFIYIILGACVSLLIQELDVKPFPSLTFIVSSAFLILCITVLLIANWRR